MNILILGSRGMLGAYLKETFKDQEVTAWDREDFDITLTQALENRIQKLAPEVIINAAAYNQVDRAEEEEELANLINGQAPGYLAQAANLVGATLIHYSTNFVFDGAKKAGYEEDDEPSPLSAYARSKYLGERLILDQARHYPGLEYYILRTSYLFGRLGTSLGAKKGFVNIILEEATAGKEIKAVADEWACHTYALDLARRTREILEWRQPKGLYHITNTGACTWHDFIKEMLQIKKINAKLVAVEQRNLHRPAPRPTFSELLNTKLPAMRGWQEALTEFLNNSK